MKSCINSQYYSFLHSFEIYRAVRITRLFLEKPSNAIYYLVTYVTFSVLQANNEKLETLLYFFNVLFPLLIK